MTPPHTWGGAFGRGLGLFPSSHSMVIVVFHGSYFQGSYRGHPRLALTALAGALFYPTGAKLLPLVCLVFRQWRTRVLQSVLDWTAPPGLPA